MFSKPLSPLKSQKQTKAFFKVSWRFVLVLKPLSLAITRKQENPVNTAQKMASKSSTKQDGEATTEEVPGSIVTYTEEEINTFKDDMAPENTKKSTPLAIVLNRDT